MTDRLAIFGCGGFGREVAAWIQRARPATELCFLDDDPPASTGPSRVARLEESEVGLPVLIAVGDPDARRRLEDRVAAAGFVLSTFVDPSAYVADGALIGDGCIVGPFAYLGPAAHLARNCVVNVHASIGHDSTVGPNCVVSPGAKISGGCTISADVLIGSAAVITPGLTLGASTRVAAGSVLYRDTEPGSLASGNPAKSRVMFRPTSLRV